MPVLYGSAAKITSCNIVLHHTQAYRSISKCVAAICDSVPSETFATVDKFIGDIKVSSVVCVGDGHMTDHMTCAE